MVADMTEVRLLNVRQAARYLGTTPATLYGRVWRREVPFVKIGRSVRFDIEDLKKLIEGSRVAAQQFSAIPDAFSRKEKNGRLSKR
jgi:excisionase family DNA binding protein